MSLIEGTNIIEGTLGPLWGGAIEDAQTEVQTLTLGGTPTGGTFRLSYQGQSSAPIAWSATNATLIANVQAALRALPSIGSTGLNVTAGSLTAGIGTLLLTFAGGLVGKVVLTFAVAANNLSGTAPTLAVAKTTPGHPATQTGAARGALYQDQSTGSNYVNTGTEAAPAWGFLVID